MGNRIDGTGTRAGNGKPGPLQSEEKLRSGNLESAAEKEPSPRGLVGIKPSSGPNPEDGSSRAARLGEDRPDPSAVETQNLKRAIVGRRSSRGDRCEDSKGRPNARRDADPDERCPGRMKAESEPRGTADAKRAARVNLA
jgi:hypothetical protein